MGSRLIRRDDAWPRRHRMAWSGCGTRESAVEAVVVVGGDQAVEVGVAVGGAGATFAPPMVADARWTGRMPTPRQMVNCRSGELKMAGKDRHVSGVILAILVLV